MKIFSLIIVLVSLANAGQEDSVIRLSNGDQLSGNMVSLTLDGLSWKSQALHELAEFNLEHVMDLRVSGKFRNESDTISNHEAVIRLSNGDVIKGQLSGLADDKIRLTTWYAGELVFPRVNVKSVDINKTSKVIYNGPKGINEWTQSADLGGWTYEGGQLVSHDSGSVARDFDLTDQVKIAFDASWRGELESRLIIYSSDVSTTRPKAGYEIVFHGQEVYLKKIGKDEIIGQTSEAAALRENEKSRIEIRANTKTEEFLLYINDEFIEIWKNDEQGATKLGKGIHFIAQDSSPVKISNITISEWDGYKEDAVNKKNILIQNRFQGGFRNNGLPEPTKVEEELKEGQMALINGDIIEGEVTGIEGDLIELKTPYSEVRFPINRLKNITLSDVSSETAKLYKGDVRGTLLDGSNMVFRLDGVEDKSIIGFSQNFGQAKFSKDAFSRIEFNIYPRRDLYR